MQVDDGSRAQALDHEFRRALRRPVVVLGRDRADGLEQATAGERAPHSLVGLEVGWSPDAGHDAGHTLDGRSGLEHLVSDLGVGELC